MSYLGIEPMSGSPLLRSNHGPSSSCSRYHWHRM